MPWAMLMPRRWRLNDELKSSNSNLTFFTFRRFHHEKIDPFLLDDADYVFVSIGSSCTRPEGIPRTSEPVVENISISAGHDSIYESH